MPGFKTPADTMTAQDFNRLPRIGDPVDLLFPDATTASGHVADLSDETVRIDVNGRPEYRAIIIHRRRLTFLGPGRWWLDV